MISEYALLYRRLHAVRCHVYDSIDDAEQFLVLAHVSLGTAHLSLEAMLLRLLQGPHSISGRAAANLQQAMQLDGTVPASDHHEHDHTGLCLQLEMATGRTMDTYTIPNDFIHLANNSGANLYDDLLAICAVSFSSFKLLLLVVSSRSQGQPS